MENDPRADAGHEFARGKDGRAPRTAPIRTNPASVDVGRSAADAFDALLRLYVCAVADNLHCTLNDPDPEGPHQLRVTLRRLRAALVTFRPVLRRKLRKRLARAARDLGRMVSDLRDADVMIEEIIQPALSGDARDAALIAALDGWREDVRKRVRGNLLTARAAEFTGELRRAADLGTWRPQGKRKRGRLAGPAAALTGPAVDAAWRRAALRGGRVARLPPAERHELRKDLKALRYAAEISAAVTSDSGSQAFLSALKRLQAGLGYLNDLATLQLFDPPVPDANTAQGLKRLRRRLIAEHAGRAEAALVNAQKHWNTLAKAERFWR